MSKIPRILEDLYLKNLQFFKKQNPQIYNVISKASPDHTKIIITDEGKIDLIYNGKRIYGGDAIDYAEKEVLQFQSIYKDKVRRGSISTITPGLYISPRFFHQHLDLSIKKMYESAKELRLNTINHNNRHDFVIITGIGLGLHITEILENIDIQNILILETDFELLALSCFFTDWQEIYEKQSPKNKKSISMILLEKKEIDVEQGMLWNELIKRAPHFPFNTLTYNHGRHDKYGAILKKINSDITMFISLWGFYDDEVNQLNHTMHNIQNNINLIPNKKNFKWTKPVIVCGSGPSLDSRIDQLKSIRNDCILLSAGSSLHALLNYNIIPDYHIELESDYGVFHVLDTIDKNTLKKITLICALQCTPLITNLFKNCFAYVKDSMSIGDIIEKKENKLIEPTPTCVNAALSFAFQYEANNIYLFGTDFGFYDESNHHSKKSMYEMNDMDQKGVSDLKNITENTIKNNFKKPGYNGDCLTTATYYTTKRRIEMSLITNNFKYKNEVFNISDGLIIEGTTHKKVDDKLIINMSNELDNILLFENSSRQATLELNKKIKDTIYYEINNLCKIFRENIKLMDVNISGLSAICWSLSNYLNGKFIKDNGPLVFFIRGTVWHYMLAGYSIAYACDTGEDTEKQDRIIGIWRERFMDFLDKLPEDLLKTLSKDRTKMEEDVQLTRTIREKVS